MLKELFLYRIPTAAVSIAAIVGIFWIDYAVFRMDVLFAGLTLLVGALTTLEIYRMADGSRRQVETRAASDGTIPPQSTDSPGDRVDDEPEKTPRIRPMKVIGVAFTIMLIIVTWLTLKKDDTGSVLGTVTIPPYYMSIALSIMLLGIILARARRASKLGHTQFVIQDVSLTLFGILAGWFLVTFTLRLRHMGPGGEPFSTSTIAQTGQTWLIVGQGMVIVTLFTAKCMDIGGFIIGKLIGRHKITPLVSPNKTWEGFFGGLTLSILAGVALHFTPAFDFVPLWQAIVFSACVSVAGFFGDLAGSLLKRSTNVKDTGGYIRGWGGMIDMIDSLLVAGPVAILLLDLFSIWR